MAGTIIADTLTHSTAGSIATNYVVDGSAKMRCSFDQITNTIDGSFNVSSLTDDGTGQTYTNFTNNFTDGTYSFVVSGSWNRTAGKATARSSSQGFIKNATFALGAADGDDFSELGAGDLA